MLVTDVARAFLIVYSPPSVCQSLCKRFTLYLILKNHFANFNQILHWFLDDGNSFCLNEESHPFSSEDDYKTLKIPYPRL